MQTHLEILKDAYFCRHSRNSSYSLRAFARDLRVSHGFLSRVLANKKRFSLLEAQRIAESLGLDAAKKHLFMQGVGQSYITPRVILANSTRKAEQERSDFVLELDRFKILSEWHHFAIWEIIDLKSFRPDKKWIASYLGIPLGEVKTAVKRLQRAKLLEISKKKWTKACQNIFIPTSYSDKAIRQFHKSMIEKALKELECIGEKDYRARDITGTLIAADPNRLQTAKKRIAAFRKSLMNYLSGGTPTTLYQLNVQLFAIGKDERQ